MTTAKEPVPVPKEPPELIAKRTKIVADLEKQAQSASGAVQAAMRKMIQVFKAMDPNAPLDEQLYADFKGAFARLATDPGALPPPPIFTECVEYLQARISALAPQFPTLAPQAAAMQATAPAPAQGAAPAAAGVATKRGSDGFEGSSGGARKPMSLGGDAPPPPATQKDAQQKQQELESFKTWMKNPGLGKMKG